ncbi:hypothetical protein HK100_011989 [Physocladia obscura]|uniref:DUF1279 domain-containing protein n=1 Tax=Physocladia obscura TaxID=109957 RepID=A0AAD5XGK8_9FUNG|nr:hypothetical protein HK100_011989 [Physocladia obscura]
MRIFIGTALKVRLAPIQRLTRHNGVIQKNFYREYIGGVGGGEEKEKEKAKEKEKEKGGIAALLAKHGPAALVTYAGLSGVSFVVFYAAVVWSGVDPKRLLERLPLHSTAATTTFESSNTTTDGNATDSNSLDSFLHASLDNAEDVVAVGKEGLGAILDHGSDRSNSTRRLFAFDPTTLFVAWCVHELFVPIRLGLTAYLTPRVAARMKGGIVDVWMHNAMRRVKDAWDKASFKSR